jgi:hypothetical protein
VTLCDHVLSVGHSDYSRGGLAENILFRAGRLGTVTGVITKRSHTRKCLRSTKWQQRAGRSCHSCYRTEKRTDAVRVEFSTEQHRQIPSQQGGQTGGRLRARSGDFSTRAAARIAVILLIILLSSFSFLKVVDPFERSDGTRAPASGPHLTCAGRAFSVSRKSQKDYSSGLNNPLPEKHSPTKAFRF